MLLDFRGGEIAPENLWKRHGSGLSLKFEFLLLVWSIRNLKLEADFNMF